MEFAKARRAMKRGPRLGGHVLADALVAQGIDHVFEVPGESFLDTLDGLYDVRRQTATGHLPVRGRRGQHGRGVSAS